MERTNNEQLLEELRTAVKDCTEKYDLQVSWFIDMARSAVGAAIKNCVESGIPNEQIRPLLQPLVDQRQLKSF